MQPVQQEPKLVGSLALCQAVETFMLIGCFEQVRGLPESKVIQCQATKPFSLSLSLSVWVSLHTPQEHAVAHVIMCSLHMDNVCIAAVRSPQQTWWDPKD